VLRVAIATVIVGEANIVLAHRVQAETITIVCPHDPCCVRTLIEGQCNGHPACFISDVYADRLLEEDEVCAVRNEPGGKLGLESQGDTCKLLTPKPLNLSVVRSKNIGQGVDRGKSKREIDVCVFAVRIDEELGMDLERERQHKLICDRQLN